LSSGFCHELIEHFESNPHSDGGMASIDATGNPFHKIDHNKKKREDCIITPADAVHERILNALARRCLPEIKKAFQFDVSYTDRILIARYDHTGGYFLRHRDNVAPSIAFRQFAISINLNTEYDGGYLLFPEYNSHRYRPPQGSGIIFSASLLHEATAITRGSRYVLLTFFHNQEAEALRLRIIADAQSGTPRFTAAK